MTGHRHWRPFLLSIAVLAVTLNSCTDDDDGESARGVGVDPVTFVLITSGLTYLPEFLQASASPARPRASVGELTRALADAANPAGAQVADILSPEQLVCVAEALEESELSDDALQALVEGDEDYEGSDEDEQALQDIATEDVAECVEATLE